MNSIYVLDDTLYLHERYRLSFNKKEFDVQTFKDEQNFLKAFSVYQPDVILLDYDLGSEKNGYDIAKCIRSVNEDIPIIIISGNITTRLVMRFEPINIFNFIQKPFKTATLVDSVLQVLDRVSLYEVSGELRKMRILAIDDNEQILNLYKMALGEKYEVITCKTMLDVRKQTSVSVQLIIMDYNIVGENFDSIREFVTKRFKGAKKVLVSGSLDTYILNNSKSDFHAFLEKPVSMSILEKMIERLIE